MSDGRSPVQTTVWIWSGFPAVIPAVTVHAASFTTHEVHQRVLQKLAQDGVSLLVSASHDIAKRSERRSGRHDIDLRVGELGDKDGDDHLDLLIEAIGEVGEGPAGVGVDLIVPLLECCRSTVKFSDIVIILLQPGWIVVSDSLVTGRSFGVSRRSSRTVSLFDVIIFNMAGFLCSMRT